METVSLTFQIYGKRWKGDRKTEKNGGKVFWKTKKSNFNLKKTRVSSVLTGAVRRVFARFPADFPLDTVRKRIVYTKIKNFPSTEFLDFHRQLAQVSESFL